MMHDVIIGVIVLISSSLGGYNTLPLLRTRSTVCTCMSIIILHDKIHCHVVRGLSRATTLPTNNKYLTARSKNDNRRSGTSRCFQRKLPEL